MFCGRALFTTTEEKHLDGDNSNGSNRYVFVGEVSRARASINTHSVILHGNDNAI